MSITQQYLQDTIVSQRVRLSNSILTAQTQEDLERAQIALDAVTPLWAAVGDREHVVALQQRLRKRAAHLLLEKSDQLSLYQPGRGLWESARNSIRGLTDLVSN